MKRAFGYFLSVIPTGYALAYVGQHRRAVYWFIGAIALTRLSSLALSETAVHTLVPVFFLGVIPAILGLVLGNAVVSIRAVRRASEFRFKSFFVYLLATVLVTSALGSLGGDSSPRSWVMPSSSMEPNLLHGERFYAKPLVGGKPAPRGSMRLFSSPDNPSVVLVKRVVAVGGDRVKVFRGELWVNGAKKTNGSHESSDSGQFFIHPVGAAEPPQPFDQWEGEIPKGHVFLLGDNRANSYDSRSFGPLPESSLLAVPLFVWWGRMGKILLTESAVGN